MKMVYFDHAASSWPKPPAVVEKMAEAVMEYGANPGRGSHKLALRASRVLFETRFNLARLFNIKDPNMISFTLNTSSALNQAIKGYLKKGDHVITTEYEHNSIRRPLEFLRGRGDIEITYLKATEEGSVDLNQLQQCITSKTKMLACTHSSNLLGNILPIKKMSSIVKAFGIKILLDAAQTAGSYPVDVKDLGVDMLAFPGHKGLLGPQGTGGLYIAPEIGLEPLIHGGTGAQSEEIDQPLVRPERYETGTQNTPGIAGLNEGVKYVMSQTVEKICRKEACLTQKLIHGLSTIDEITLLGPEPGKERTAIVSFLCDRIESSKLAFILDKEFNIAVRAGLHCTPLSHQAAGTIHAGAVRASIGCYTSDEEVNYFIQSMKQICQRSSFN